MLAIPAAGRAVCRSVWTVVCPNLRLTGLSTMPMANAPPGTGFALIRISKTAQPRPATHPPPRQLVVLHIAEACAPVQGIDRGTNAAWTASMGKPSEPPRHCTPHRLTAGRVPQCQTARWQRYIFTRAPSRAVTAVTADKAPTASEVATAADDQISPAKRRPRKVTQEEGVAVKRTTTRKPAAKAKASKSAQPAEQAGDAADKAAAGTGLRA